MSHQITVNSTNSSNIFQINGQDITFTPSVASTNPSILNYPVDIANIKLETNIPNDKVSLIEPGGLEFYINEQFLPVTDNITYGYVLIADNAVTDIANYTFSSTAGQFAVAQD